LAWFRATNHRHPGRRNKVGALLRPKSASKRILDRNAYFGEEHIHTSWSLDA
jgi:hypothetical protein